MADAMPGGRAYLLVADEISQVVLRCYPLGDPDLPGTPFMVAAVTLEAVCMDGENAGQQIGRAFAATYAESAMRRAGRGGDASAIVDASGQAIGSPT